MMVRPKKRAPSYKGAGPTPKQPASAHMFPSPIRGWVLNENLAMPGPGGARILDNWICTTTGIAPRAGVAVHVPLESPVRSLFTYRSGAFELFFAGTATELFDITTSAVATPAAVVSGQTSGAYSSEQFGTAGGDYLYAVNGADDAQLFDGIAWTAINDVSTPAITGVATSDLSQVWSFANRLFFVKRGTKSAFYLPVDSIGGAANEFSLAGIFKRGGSLLFGATWSLDAGDGLDDKCIFVSTEGEVAIYEGINPGSAADWRKVGVYQITKPLGPKAILQAGGDLLIATENGLVPISAAIQKDIAALEMSAVSRAITPYWQTQITATFGRDWEIVKWPQKNIMLVSQPDDLKKTALVANLQTGAWSRFTGLDTQCMGFFDGSAFFGDTAGNVYRMQSSGSDNGTPYTCAYLGQHEGLEAPGVEKTILQVRATFTSRTPIAPLVSAKTDYDFSLSQAPASSSDDGAPGVWDVGTWDESVWDEAGRLITNALWSSVGRTGRTVAPEVQLTFGVTTEPDAELVSIDATYRVGALVT